MKNKLLLTLYALLIAGSFGFMGCDDDEKSGSTGAPAAETVTLADLQAIETPSGSGTTPAATKDATMEITDNLMTVSETITEAVEEIVNPSAKAVVKNLKRAVVTSLVKSKAPQTTPINDSYDKSGSIDAATIGFISGSIDYDSTGTISGSATFDNETGLESFSGNSTGSDKLTLTNLVTQADLKLNGFVNENFVVNFNESSTVNSEYVYTSISNNTSIGFSHRSGYSISGSTVKCYVVISADITASVNVSLDQTDLAGMTEYEIEDYIDDQYTASGSMTVTVYDADGVQSFQQVFTAEEFMAMDEDEEEEPAPVE